MAYNLEGFVKAQERMYTYALEEMKMGRKQLIGCGLFFRSLNI